MFFTIQNHSELNIKYLHQDRTPDMLDELVINLNQVGYVSIEKDRVEFVLPVQLCKVQVEFKTTRAAQIFTEKLKIELCKISNPPYRICGGI